MTKSLDNRVAVITGASSGIGEAAAKALVSRGARVALIARRKERLEALRAELGDKARVYAIDVTDRAAVTAAAADIVAAFGHVDIVVNNAGVMLPNPIEDNRADQWQQQIDLNISGLMNVIGAFTGELVKSGASGVADLINISSIGARNIYSQFAVYCATKAYVTHLSVQLRSELGAKGVRVSALEPGFTATELQSHVDLASAKEWLDNAKTQLEWLRSEDIAELIAFTVGLPKRVNLQTVTIMPTGQAS